MDELISRQAAIEALGEGAMVNYQAAGHDNGLIKAIDVIKGLPSAQQGFDTDQKINKAYDDGYDQGYLQCKMDQEGTMGQEERMNEWMIFAERLSEQMKKQNLSIRQLAERMGMTSTTIYRYANGQRVPRANEILKASDALRVTCDYLLGLSDDPKKTSRPSAEPEKTQLSEEDATKDTTYDCISRQAALDAVMDEFKKIPTNAIRAKTRLEQLPPAQPERKKGRCIWCDSPFRIEYYWIDREGNTASFQDEERHIVATGIAKFCPNCGADMKGEKNG